MTTTTQRQLMGSVTPAFALMLTSWMTATRFGQTDLVEVGMPLFGSMEECATKMGASHFAIGYHRKDDLARFAKVTEAEKKIEGMRPRHVLVHLPMGNSERSGKIIRHMEYLIRRILLASWPCEVHIITTDDHPVWHRYFFQGIAEATA